MLHAKDTHQNKWFSFSMEGKNLKHILIFQINTPINDVISTKKLASHGQLALSKNY